MSTMVSHTAAAALKAYGRASMPAQVILGKDRKNSGARQPEGRTPRGAGQQEDSCGRHGDGHGTGHAKQKGRFAKEPDPEMHEQVIEAMHGVDVLDHRPQLGQAPACC